MISNLPRAIELLSEDLGSKLMPNLCSLLCVFLLFLII